MKAYTHIIWDFNGTVLDDVDIGIQSANRLLKKRGLPLMSGKAEYQSKFGFPIIDYYRRLGLDFSKEPYDVMAHEWVRSYLELAPLAPVYPGVKEAMTCFASHGLFQVLMSATELSMLQKQLVDLGMAESFDLVLGLDNIYANSKLHLAEKWRRENPTAVALMLGDTEHDHQVAEAMGVDCFLIAQGHQNRSTLEACGCPVFDDLFEVTAFLFGK
ncbi:MAG: HAD family hydrolase [Clostridia bacterium]|nr:HAD family hydrolase [Clostridia bacterium]